MPKRQSNYKKLNDPATKNRPWSSLPKRVRHLPHYELPPPYQHAKIWHPGDGAKGRLLTGDRRLPPEGAPKVRTMIMPGDGGHHPYGPSILAGYSPQHGGCGNLIPHKGTHPLAETGSLQHSVSVDGNYERLGGLTKLEEEVRWARVQIDRLYEEGFKDEKFGGREDRKFDGEEFVETTFGIPGLNFGTVDRLRYSADGTRAIVIDLKFGAWPVTPPKGRPRGGKRGGGGNLQLLNYAIYAFFLKNPMPHSVTVAIVHAKSRTVMTHVYWRRSVYLLKRRVAKLILRAERGKTDPASIGYYPNSLNCSWCDRINCPARLDLASSLITLWNQEKVVLPRPDLLNVSTEQLGVLKTFANALSRCVDAINEECKRRAFDEDDLIPGYEIKTRSGKRRIIGANNISEACNLVMSEWPKWFPQSPLDLSQVALELTELGVDDLEQAAQRAAPKGKMLRAKELVGRLMNNPLVQNSAVYYLAAKIPKQES